MDAHARRHDGVGEDGALPHVKFAVVFGTRPEAIKLAPVVKELRARQQKVVSISTGQHRSMLWQAVDFFGVNVDHDLGAMREGQTLPQLLSRIMADTEAVLRSEKPDVVIVQGDTATALGTAMSAYMSRMRVAHVEAGLRTFDEWNPFPEEANRTLLARVARWHFCPTDTAKQNLLREGIDGRDVHITGNTVVDALCWGREKIRMSDPDASRARLAQRLGITPDALHRFVLVTSHRRENFGRPLQDICEAICEIEARRRDLHIIWPVHLNPEVRREVQRLVGTCGQRLIRIEPVDYETMLLLLGSCSLILTDSGGIQEEAAVFHKPVLIMRDATERPEILESGGGMLVGTERLRIVEAVGRVLDDDELRNRMSSAVNPFGDGHAAERIVDVLLS